MESEECNFPNKLLFLSLRTQRICCNCKILSLYQSTKNVSEIRLLLISIQSIVCSPDPEPRVSDDMQDSKRVPPPMQRELSCFSIQQLESKNHQATDWKTSHQIPRHGYVLLLQVLQSLKVRIEDELLPRLFLFGTFPRLCSGNNPCLRRSLSGWYGRKPNLLKAISAFDNRFLPLRPLVHQAKSSSDRISESCACSSPKKSSASYVYTLVLSFFLLPFSFFLLPSSFFLLPSFLPSFFLLPF